MAGNAFNGSHVMIAAINLLHAFRLPVQHCRPRGCAAKHELSAGDVHVTLTEVALSHINSRTNTNKRSPVVLVDDFESVSLGVGEAVGSELGRFVAGFARPSARPERKRCDGLSDH